MAYATDFDPSITINLGNAGAVAGTTSTFTTTAATNCVIAGKFCTPLAVQTNAASPTLDAATGLAFTAMTPNQACALVFGVNAAGALLVCQGKPVATNLGVTTTAGSLMNDPQFPGLPDNFCPVAYTIVRTAPSAAPWTPGTGAWAASGVSASTFTNVAWLPPRPQAS